jgi:carbamoyl-phosphate synthase large subunit|tara:strand:- start:6257 stop:7210 length:954 start_codon:yes stop_codon:yes gene_type:complete
MQSLNKLKNKRIFISGGAGIIGKELVKLLLDLNVKIFVGDLKKRPKEFTKKIIYRRGDLNKLKENDLKRFRPDIIFHLAASYERTEESFSFYNTNFLNNIKLSNHILKLSKKINTLKRFIFASSYLVYDENLYLVKKNQNSTKSINENSKKDSRNLIGSSKLFHEKEIEFFSNFMPKCNFVIARIFRGYGLNSRDVISRWIRAALRNKTLNVYGENGSFDYIYSEDTAAALISCVACKKKITYLNVGSGTSIKINKTVKILKNYFPKLKIRRKKSINIIEKSRANIKKIKMVTNWKPKINLSTGIKKILEYERKKIN